MRSGNPVVPGEANLRQRHRSRHFAMRLTKRCSTSRSSIVPTPKLFYPFLTPLLVSYQFSGSRHAHTKRRHSNCQALITRAHPYARRQTILLVENQIWALRLLHHVTTCPKSSGRRPLPPGDRIRTEGKFAWWGAPT